MTMYGLQMDGVSDDTRRAKITRAALGAFYGFLGGAAFVFVAAFIDIWLHPDLPLGVDWSTFAARLPLIALGLALIGAVTCWWNEAWQGLLSGSAVSAALALIAALFSAQVAAGMKIVVLVFILLPVAAMTLPIAWVLRRLMERHAFAMRHEQGRARLAWLVVITLGLGAAGGYFMKMPARAVDATRVVDGLLQNPAQADNPIGSVEGASGRQGVPYLLYQKPSIFSTEGFDVRAAYEDGFALTCVVVLYPGRDPYVSICRAEK